MNLTFLTAITAISGLLYTYVSLQRDYLTPVLGEILLAITLFGAVVLFVEIINRSTTGALRRTNKQVPSDLLRLSTSIILYSVFGLIILKFVYEQDISALLAASAVLSVALGLALREPLGHIFSGLTLEIARPLSVGDYIKANNLAGRVEALSWRAVHVRTKDRSMIIFPNSRLADNSIEIFPRGEVCSHYMDVAIPNDVPPTTVLDAAREALSGNVPYVADASYSTVVATEMDPETGSIQYRLRFGTTEYFKLDAIRTVLMERLWHALSRNGVDMSRLNRYRGRDRSRSVTPPGENFLHGVPEFKGLAAGSIELLARQLVCVSYAKGEVIRAHVRRPRSLFIIGSGRVLVRFVGAARAVVDEEGQEQPALVDREVVDSLWEGHVLEEIAGQLVQLMGPVSRHLVDIESSRTNDKYTLYQRLAAHLDDEAERAAFLVNCPRELTLEREVGDTVCYVPQFDEPRAGRREFSALTKTDLFELSAQRAERLPADDPDVANALDSLFKRARLDQEAQVAAR